MKIITAIGNPYINNKLREISDHEIVGKDIQYQEGILELIEVKKDIDIVILSNNLPLEIEFKELINKIINLKKNIEIIVFLKEKDTEIELFLNSKKVYKIYYLNSNNYDIFLNNFCKNIKKTKEQITTEIKDFKGLILRNNSINIEKNLDKNSENNLEKNFIEKENIVFKKNNVLNNNLRKLSLKKYKNNKFIIKKNRNSHNGIKINNFNNRNIEKKYDEKIIVVSGVAGAGKSIFSCILSKFIEKEGKKILLIDLDENNSISTILGIKANKNNLSQQLVNQISSNIYILLKLSILELEGYKIIELLEKLRQEYDFIIIDISTVINSMLTKVILKKADKIIFLVIPNLLEIKKSKNLLEVYHWDMEIDNNKIKIIFNKCNNNSISKDILKEIFYKYEILDSFKYDEKYTYYINNNFNILIDNAEYKEIYKNL